MFRLAAVVPAGIVGLLWPLNVLAQIKDGASSTASQVTNRSSPNKIALGDLGATDVFSTYQLPPPADSRTSPLWSQVSKLQVFSRAQTLSLTIKSPIDAWKKADNALGEAIALANRPMTGQAIKFSGKNVSDLNALIRRADGQAIRVVSDSLIVNEPLFIRINRLTLDLGNTTLIKSAAVPYLVRIEDSADVILNGGIFKGDTSGLLISTSRRVVVRNSEFTDLTGVGILITHSANVVACRNRITRVRATPILIHGSAQSAVIMENEIYGNLGPLNTHAGIVLTDRNGDFAADPLFLFRPQNGKLLEQPISHRFKNPRFNVIKSNTIVSNLSSGIYVDGAIQNLILSNDIERNSKEGLCLDHGSTANVIAFNRISKNGQRWGKTDQDLRNEFVFQHGKLPDGTSAAKLPGVSLDNALYNLVYSNQVIGNYGGGIKMVRTSFFNVIGLNYLSNNNNGESAVFHFFGIELGSAIPDSKVLDMDFTPSRGNTIFSNTIRGNHYAGVFLSVGSDQNTLIENAIFGKGPWAIESVREQQNHSTNNLTNLPSRHQTPGLDAKLLDLNSPRVR